MSRLLHERGDRVPTESLLPAALGVGLFLVPALALFFGGTPDRRTAVALVLGLLAVATLATLEWLLLGSTLEVSLYQAALSAAGASVVLSIALRGARLLPVIAVTLVLAAVGFVPLGFALFDLERGPIVVQLGTLDFGGVATLALIPGCVAAASVLLARRRQAPLQSVPVRPRWLLAASAVAAVIGFASASLGAQLVFDDLIGTLVRNAVVAAAAGVVGWTITQVINVRRASWAGAAAGVMAGSIAVLAASPWLNVVSVVVLALLSGILGHVVAAAVRRGAAGLWATVIGVCLVPGAVGMIGPGIVASGAGLLLSGHVDLLQAQFVGLLVVLLCATLVSLPLVLLLRRFG